MIQENQEQEVVEENFDLPQVEEGQEDSTDWKVEAEKLKEKAIRQRENTKSLKAQIKELEKPKPQDKKEEKKSDTELLDRIDELALQGDCLD